MDGYHSIFFQGTATITSTYNGRLQKHLHTMDGYHNIYLQCQNTITSSYIEW
jgi:hypothetical protein